MHTLFETLKTTVVQEEYMRSSPCPSTLGPKLTPWRYVNVVNVEDMLMWLMSFRYKTQVPMANLHLATRRRCNRAGSIQTIWNFPPILFFALWHARVYIRDFSPPCASPGYYQLFPWRPCNSQVRLTCKSRP